MTGAYLKYLVSANEAKAKFEGESEDLKLLITEVFTLCSNNPELTQVLRDRVKELANVPQVVEFAFIT